MQIGHFFIRRITQTEFLLRVMAMMGNNDAVQPGQRAAGLGDILPKEPEPKNRDQRKNLGTRNAKGARANDSSHSKIAPPKNPK